MDRGEEGERGERGRPRLRVLPQTCAFALLFLLLLLLLLLLASCAPRVSEGKAAEIAKGYVLRYGVFYTKGGEKEDIAKTTNTVRDYTVTAEKTEDLGKDWLVRVEIASPVNGTIKRASVAVLVNKESGAASVLRGQ